jgi:hypothetical protein
MDLSDWLKLIALLVTILSLFVGGLLSLFVLYKFVPKLHLEVEPSVLKGTNQLLLTLSMENISSVYAPKKNVRLQILAHGEEAGSGLSEWVPFAKDRIRSGEEPSEWSEPKEVFETTTGLHAGEKLSVQYMVPISPGAKFLHVGFQYVANLRGIHYWLSGLFSPHEQWTTTIVIPIEEESES